MDDGNPLQHVVTLDRHFNVVSELGRGGMGRVVLAQEVLADTVPVDDEGSERVAIKLLEAPELRRAFAAAFALARRLTHPAAVRAYSLDVERGTGRLLSVMEWCRGGAMVPGSVAGVAGGVRAAAELLRLLDQLHGLGHAHGDLSPHNILVGPGPKGAVKVVDLGAAGQLGTGEGRTTGTLAWTAPERLEGAPLSVAADLWSLGALIFSLLHGDHPFPGYPSAEAMTTGPTRPAGSATSLGPWLDRLLSRRAADRFPSAAAALAALEEATGKSLPLVPKEELHTRFERLPFVDVEGYCARLVAQLRTAGDSAQPLSLTVGGPRGSGRSRMLEEVRHRLAAHGIPTLLERIVPGDAPGAAMERVLAHLELPSAAEKSALAAARTLMAHARERDQPLLVLVDDVDAADAETRRALELVQRTCRRAPHRAGRLLLLRTADVGDVTLEPWNVESVDALIHAVFPGRRVGVRVAEPIRKACGGWPGGLARLLPSLARAGTLQVNAAAVHLEGEVKMAARPGDGAAQLDGLSQALRAEAALLAHARGPVPMSVVRHATALTKAEVLTRVRSPEGPRAAVRSGGLAVAARRLVPETEAWATWAERLSSQPRWRGEALWYAVRSGQAGARDKASRALAELDPPAAARLALELMGEDWPRSAEEAATAADAMEQTARLEEAGTLWRRAAELATGDPSALAQARARLGCLEARQARHASAIEELEAALPVAEAGTDRGLVATVLGGLARSAVLTGRLAEAETWGKRALEAAGEDALRRGAALYALGLRDWYRGDHDAAEARLLAALEDVRAAGDAVEEGAVVTGLGLVAHRRGDLEAAAAHYRQALEVAEAAGDEPRVLTSLQNLGVVLHERGRFTEALDTYEEALELAETLDQTGRVVQLAGNLGHLWRYLGELQRARDVVARGLELARREGNRYMQGRLLLLLGEAASADEAWDDAERLLGLAVEAAEEAQSAVEEAEARIEWTRLLLSRQDYGRARAMAEAAAGVARAAESKGLEVQALALLGAAHGRSVHGDEARAGRCFQRALEGLEEITSPDGQWPVLLEAFRYARLRDEVTDAAAHADAVRRILRQLEDAVPARHRSAFRRLRERREAWAETSAFHGSAAGASHVEVAGSGGDERWARLVEINKRLGAEHKAERLLEYIMDSAISLSGAERGFLLMADDRGREGVDVKIARNLDQENIRNTKFKLSQGIARRVIETGELALTIDAMEDARYRDQLSVHDLKLRSVLCLPMTIRGEVLGAIYLDNRFRASAFGAAEVRMLEAFADQAAIALDTARLLEAMDASTRKLESAQKEVEGLNQQLQAQLEERTRQLEDTHRVVIRQQRQLTDRHQYDRIIGESDPIREVFAVMDRLLDNTIPVLIEGESGTGKELVARAIHYNSTRAKRPLIAVNCAAIPANLLESELFGHVRGAFTGASADKKGLFEAADGGTLLLDELGELPLEMQVKLLRVLQSGEVKKVGSTRDIRVDVRIVAATNRQLEAEVAAGRFREDLYYRLAVIPIRLPPLRERRDDIPLLVQHFVAQNEASGLGRVKGLSQKAMTLLMRYHWPGNVRQLEMVLKNASLFAESDVLQPGDFQSFPELTGVERASSSLELSGRPLADIERDAIIQALRDNRGNKKRSAEQLGIDRRTLYNKLAAYNIVVEKELTVR